MIFGIIDYGASNIFSLIHALKRLNINTKIIGNPKEIESLDAVILPGVGNFTSASQIMLKFKENLLKACESNIPIFGICLGLQLFFEESEEGFGKGLAFLDGKVVKFKVNLKVPHMGWNSIKKVRSSTLLKDLNSEAWAYFAHSYYPLPKNDEIIKGVTDYGIEFPSVIEFKNLFGTQFHPEKSGITGQRILNNFIEYLKK
jgi:imidazole glycerol phosphate synthase, glutamine amidotransferase subunit